MAAGEIIVPVVVLVGGHARPPLPYLPLDDDAGVAGPRVRPGPAVAPYVPVFEVELYEDGFGVYAPEFVLQEVERGREDRLEARPLSFGTVAEASAPRPLIYGPKRNVQLILNSPFTQAPTRRSTTQAVPGQRSPLRLTEVQR